MRARVLAGLFAFVACAASAGAQTTPEIVTLTAPDGTTLKGTYFKAAAPGPALMLLHQCNQDRRTWTTFAEKASARGFHVMTLDYRGYGESAGTPYRDNSPAARESYAKWPADVDVAFESLMARPGVDRARVGAAGASCGGAQSVMLAQRHPAVRTLVLLSGGANRESRTALASMAAMPVLGAASRDDGNAVTQMQSTVAVSTNPASRFVEYERAGHGTEMFAVEAGLEPMMLEWFDAHVKNAPQTPPQRTAPVAQRPEDAFWSAMASNDFARAREIYEAARRTNPGASVFAEEEMNLRGYELLQGGAVKGAIEVFKLNVEAYAGSANTYDSLADAYVADGNTAEALRLAEKALAVLETDTQIPEELRQAIRESAERKIRDLKK